MCHSSKGVGLETSRAEPGSVRLGGWTSRAWLGSVLWRAHSVGSARLEGGSRASSSRLASRGTAVAAGQRPGSTRDGARPSCSGAWPGGAVAAREGEVGRTHACGRAPPTQRAPWPMAVETRDDGEQEGEESEDGEGGKGRRAGVDPPWQRGREGRGAPAWTRGSRLRPRRGGEDGGGEEKTAAPANRRWPALGKKAAHARGRAPHAAVRPSPTAPRAAASSVHAVLAYPPPP